MQNWKKLGLIFDDETYNSVPVGFFISVDIIRIYATTRNSDNVSSPFYIDYNIKNKKVINRGYISIKTGSLGSFDEHGIMPTCILKKPNEVWMYYIGWNKSLSVPFRNSIGLAISKDNGLNFEKYSEGPLIDRSIYDTCFVASNCVIKEEDFYRMYYLSCDKWEFIDGELCHYYKIKYAESTDAINWQREGKICIDFKYIGEYAISSPRVIKENGIYKMWYSYRGNNKINTYRIGYSESINGLDWIRKDEEVLLEPSSDGSWDSDMLCYPFILDYSKNRYMLYNGNNYGKSGIGLAIIDN